MLQSTVEAALAAFKLPQLNQDTVIDRNKEDIAEEGKSVINTSK